MTLEELRKRLSEVDRDLIGLVAARQKIVAEIGAHKIQNSVPTRDYEREREVLKAAHDRANELGLPPELAGEIMGSLIRASLTYQERTRVEAQTSGAGKRVLIIGGAGKMGAWFGQFLSSQGFAVEIADTSEAPSPFARVADWRAGTLDYDIVIVATPMQVTGEVLVELAARRPRGLVIDIGSLKSPLKVGLKRLVEAGCKVTSIHPMFGPDAHLLSGRHVVFCDVGVPEATREARALFAPTMAEQHEMSIDDHDRLMAYVLGLSHALNLAFFTALAESGEGAPKLAHMSSTTFDSQLEVASRVADESPELYYEIQRLNAYGEESLQALKDAVERLVATVSGGDEAEFTRMMRQGRAYLAGRPRER